MLRHFRELDLRPIAAAAGLAAVGLATLSCLESRGDILFRHAFSLALGVFAMLLIGTTSSDHIRRYTPYIYVAALFILTVCLFFPPIRGASSWIVLGPLRLQPSEIAKPCVLLAVASYLGDPERLKKPLRTTIGALTLVAIPTGLILLQPDLGTALIFAAICAICIYAAGLPIAPLALAAAGTSIAAIRIVLGIADAELLCFNSDVARIFLHDPARGSLLLLLVLAIICLVEERRGRPLLRPLLLASVVIISYTASFELENHLKSHHRNRIVVFIEPDFDPQGASYNVRQSLVAVGSGGLLGRGVGDASQIRLGFLPEWHTDFVFAGIAEVFGFAGSAAVLFCFTVLLHAFLDAAKRSRDRREMILLSGIGGILAFQLLINIGMVLGLLPVIGIPLPLVSYGGSAMLGFWILIGLYQSCYRRRRSFASARDEESAPTAERTPSLIFSAKKT